MPHHLPRIAITMGDPGGIGPEIIAKAFQSPELHSLCRPLVVGDAAWMRKAVAQFAPAVGVRPLKIPEDAAFAEGVMDVLDLGNVPADLPIGRPTQEGGSAAVRFIHTAVDFARQQRVEAITTAPINKAGIHLAGFLYPGHTELLAEYTRAPNCALLMVSGKLRVVLATTHISLKDVGQHLTPERLLGTIRLTHQWLSRHIAERPTIALTGLNPHCGDGGIFGREEGNIILPAIRSAQAEGIRAEGPFSADALFPRAKTGAYDAVITMYHDQGMIPIKMESMGHAVNITLGIPIIRTSVDHGTAYDIAGKGVATYASLIEALRTAAGIAKFTPVAP